MKLWHIKRNTPVGYDQYYDAVVAAETEADARNTHPSGDNDLFSKPDDYHYTDSWISPADVIVKNIGEAAPGIEAGVICKNFNAG